MEVGGQRHAPAKLKFTPEEAMKAQRGSRGIALLFNLSARWRWVVNATPRPCFYTVYLFICNAIKM